MIINTIYLKVWMILLQLMLEEIVGKGWNIKCYDKIKLTHVSTNCRMHSNTFGYKSGSYNIAVSSHKMRDQSDWFVVVRPQQPAISYHFHYSDNVFLKNVQAKKNLHLCTEYESSISKGMEISLCDQEDRDVQFHAQDEWVVEPAQTCQDNYWRVGEIVRIKNKDSLAYLCSHRRKIRENDDYQIFGETIRLPKEVASLSSEEKQKLKEVNEKSLWMVSQILPFVYTASITEKKTIKTTQEVEELLKLNKSKDSVPIRKTIKRQNQNQELLRMQNQRLQQLQNERKKMADYESKLSCCKRYFCCCLMDDDQYKKIQ